MTQFNRNDTGQYNSGSFIERDPSNQLPQIVVFLNKAVKVTQSSGSYSRILYL